MIRIDSPHLLSGCFFCISATTVHAATLRVPADYPTIQACIDAAVSGVDECVVAPGTYHETINFLGKAITLRSSGGRDVTTIDATGIGGSVVTCRSGEGLDTLLDGFTITGGTGTPSYPGSVYCDGGGMYNYRSSPTVTNCTFHGNTVSDGGGGMYNENNSSPTVSNCIFSANTASGGGGMANLGGKATVSKCAFKGNSAISSVGYGGGIYNYSAGPTLRNCMFGGNIANHGGGIFNESSSPRVINCIFHVNSAKTGGAMLNIYWSYPKVTKCTFSGNSASTGSGGGVLNSSHSSPEMTSCTFSQNVADFGGGGMAAIFDSSATLSNCTFFGNSADQGGGIETAENSSPTLTNCILWGNTNSNGTGQTAQINNVVTAPTVKYSNVQGGLPPGVIDGGGNADLDPMFVRPPDPGPYETWDGVNDDYGDLRLQPGSPCIDAGDPAYVVQPSETDLDGHARVLCGTVDMGAYEFGIGDFDCDQTVNGIDFASFPDCMQGPIPPQNLTIPIDNRQSSIDSPCTAFDFDADSDVDLADFAGFQLIMAP